MSVLKKIVKIERIMDEMSKNELYRLHGEKKKKYRINLFENQKEKVIFEINIENIENFFLEIHKKTKRITIIGEDGKKIEIMVENRENIVIEYYIFVHGTIKRILEEWNMCKTYEFALKRKVNELAGVNVEMIKNEGKKDEAKFSFSRADGKQNVEKDEVIVVNYKNANQLNLIIQYLLSEEEI